MTDILVLRTGRIALGAAALLLMGVVGFRVFDNRAGPDAAASVTAEASAAQNAEADKAIAEINARLRADPKDVAALQALGTVSLQAQRFPQAVDAFRKAVAIKPGESSLWSSLGASLVMAEPSNRFPPAARDAFTKALAIDANDPRARYFLAIARDTDGDAKGALQNLFALLEESPADAPWVSEVRGAIQSIATREKIDVTARLAALPQASGTAAPLGPTADQTRAVAQLPPGQQQAMIAGMVEGLAAKLKAEPKNVEGWIMLMRSYATLGRAGDAGTAYRSAVAANPGAVRELDDAAKTLGIE